MNDSVIHIYSSRKDSAGTVRKRDQTKFGRIAEAASEVFASKGFTAARISDIALRAKVGPGTVYLYAETKEALFELAVLRAFESPLVASAEPPYPGTPARERRDLFRGAVEAIANFPQLWIGLQRRGVEESIGEYESILLEIANWLGRYRQAIVLAEKNRLEWPELVEAFDELIWVDLVGHLASYLKTRTKTGHLRDLGDPQLVARVTLASLAGTFLGSPISPEPLEPRITAPVASRLLVPALTS